MKHKLLFIVSLLLTLATINSCVASVSSSRFVNSWVKMKVLSFDGENIFFNLQIFTVGKHADQRMWIASEFPSDSVYVEVGRGICDVIFYEGMNVTVFSYSYSINHTLYDAGPMISGFLAFPFDEHGLALYIEPSFNLTMDAHEWNCELPSQNYEGKFKVTHAPAFDKPSRHKLTLEIKHSSSFVFGVSLMLIATIGVTYGLSILLTIIICLIAFGKKSLPSIGILIPISLAIIFFVPAFEITFQNLKSPLPLVFSDILLIFVVPWNALIIAGVVLLIYFRKQ